MFCTNCGKEIDNEAIVCPACGVATANFSRKTVEVLPKEPHINIINNNSNVNTNTNTGMAYPQKSKMTALLLCIFLGVFGIHRLYVGKIGTGILWMFTIGLCYVGWIVDIFAILTGGFRDGAGMKLK